MTSTGNLLQETPVALQFDASEDPHIVHDSWSATVVLSFREDALINFHDVPDATNGDAVIHGVNRGRLTDKGVKVYNRVDIYARALQSSQAIAATTSTRSSGFDRNSGETFQRMFRLSPRSFSLSMTISCTCSTSNLAHVEFPPIETFLVHSLDKASLFPASQFPCRILLHQTSVQGGFASSSGTMCSHPLQTTAMQN